jgi:PTS system nitrogen regulatory IIA component
MQVVDILSPGRVAVAHDKMQISSKADVLRLLAELLAQGELRLDAKAIEQLLVKREDQQSTGVGGGVAIPHAAVEDLDRILGAVLLCPDPVGFDAVDGLPVSIFFAVIGPRRAVGEHLKTLARVSRLLRDDQFRARLVGASDGAAAFALIASEEGRPP